MSESLSITLTETHGEGIGLLLPILWEAFASTGRASPEAEGISCLPPEEMVRRLVSRRDVVTYEIALAGALAGGAILTIDPAGERNTLEFFFLRPKLHGRGVGSRVWQMIEARYPNTRVWETETPAFARRNIDFYTKRCGFVLTGRYRNPHHAGGRGPEEMCRLEKRISAR